MKHLLFALTISVFLIGCKKEDNNNPENGAIDCTKSPYKIGTVVIFKNVQNNISKIDTTIINVDTVVDSKKYVGSRVISNDTAAVTGFFRVDDRGDFYSLNYSPELTQNGNPVKEMLLIKNNAPVGTSWNYEFNFNNDSVNITSNYTYKIISTTEKFTYNNKIYTNGIKVERTGTSTGTFNGTTMTFNGKSTQTYFCGIGFTNSYDSGVTNSYDSNLNTKPSYGELIFYQY